MEKMRLELDTLEVTSFETRAATPRRGTVRAQQEGECSYNLPHTMETWPPQQPEPDPGSPWTDSPTAGHTCFSCNGTCLRWECDGGGGHQQQDEKGG